MEKPALISVLIVALIGLGGLILTNPQASTALVPANQAVASYANPRVCTDAHASYTNCQTPRGGCDPGYPLFRQQDVMIKGIPTCCCIPHWSNYKKSFGGTPYQ